MNFRTNVHPSKARALRNVDYGDSGYKYTDDNSFVFNEGWSKTVRLSLAQVKERRVQIKADIIAAYKGRERETGIITRISVELSHHRSVVSRTINAYLKSQKGKVVQFIPAQNAAEGLAIAA